MKKLTALLLALVMVLAMSASAFADTGDAYNGATQTTTTDNKIPLTKTIVFINENGSSVYQPNITYSYGMTAVDPVFRPIEAIIMAHSMTSMLVPVIFPPAIRRSLISSWVATSSLRENVRLKMSLKESFSSILFLLSFSGFI